MKQTIARASLPFALVLSAAVVAACAVDDEVVDDADEVARVGSGYSGSGSGSGSGVITPQTMKCCAGPNTNNFCPKEEKDKDGNALQYTRYNAQWMDTAGAACSAVPGWTYEVAAADGGTQGTCGDYEEWNHAGDGCTAICNWDALCPGQ